MARPSTPAAHGKTEGRTEWHVLLARLLTQRAPSSFRVLSEVPLGHHPPRADLLLLRRDGVSSDDDAKVLLGLWGRIRRFALLEYKSPANPLVIALEGRSPDPNGSRPDRAPARRSGTGWL
jgi:hypothetical protein